MLYLNLNFTAYNSIKRSDKIVILQNQIERTFCSTKQTTQPFKIYNLLICPLVGISEGKG
ncbi:hypothetical protein Mucpa_4678 [Mucilaginibacter paludis DSM 18603]|uniref:Uncharacterized protein n=1 Tax=Mucilaginibacter paludis DSM 18603 TaxID=714943 RepID=H1Y0M3_9SPHI|nr:hypothetical protein Mucpa_4678 [Mucilaginibacter paludis DSM 18603]